MVSVARIKAGRSSTTTFLIIDAQSVKNTDTAKQKGYDAGKKVSGIKRHIAVDIEGFPHAIAITTANVSDRDGAILMFSKETKKTWKKVKNILCDGGYRGDRFAKEILSKTGAETEVVKRNDVPRFEIIPKRWIVERSFAWLEKCRRLYKNSETKIASSLAMVQLAFLILILKRS
jgi:transposase